MNENLAIIIQARVGSNRLFNKVLLPFHNDLSILDIIIQRLKNNKYNAKIILATSNNLKDDKIEESAIKHHVLLFRGNEEDVLDRFIKCAQKYNIEKIIRVCADNPFILSRYIDELIQASEKNKYDYISYKNNNHIPVIKTHFGLFAEYVNLNALIKVAQSTSDPLYHEHVTNYIYTHQEIFNCKLLPLPDILSNRNDLRFTCDTMDDFIVLKKIYADYLNKYHTENIKIENLISIVDSNKNYLVEMAKGIKMFEK